MAAADLAALESAVAGADAVLSGPGPHSDARQRRVPRADAAHLMLRVVGQPQTIHQATGIASWRE